MIIIIMIDITRFTRWTGLGINMCKLDRGQLKSLQRVLLAAAVLLAGLNFTLTVYQQRIFKYTQSKMFAEHDQKYKQRIISIC